ncbi:MAG: hypothetical protein F4164_15430 [Gemmatimonadales bacterium]|nr:hypothetical protein [Gemmatimonadales bacterium]MYG50726.1 hypothetical protein [Gemmatimonadales bacterium]MYK02668.1 hypothetical protein [Candidatus Palauibacter ramosifaciens]
MSAAGLLSRAVGVREGPGVRVAVVMAAAAFALAGCASREGAGAEYGTDLYGAESAEAAVGRFLEAAKLRDHAAMARLFGTGDGPAERRWGRAETEQRMFVLAGLLAPSGYELRPNPVVGVGGASRWMVDLRGTRNGVVSVPFLIVSDGSRWFVERIGTEGLRTP